MVSQNTPRPSLSRKAGRGFLRMLRGLLGDKNLERARESLDTLRSEYREGRAEAEGRDPPPRAIPHGEKPPT